MKGHWLWSVVMRLWPTWSYVILAALVINLLGLALPLFVMNVYDRVIPNNSVPTLWALAAGVAIALGADFVLRMLRAGVIENSGRRVDMRVSAGALRAGARRIDGQPRGAGRRIRQPHPRIRSRCATSSPRRASCRSST